MSSNTHTAYAVWTALEQKILLCLYIWYGCVALRASQQKNLLFVDFSSNFTNSSINEERISISQTSIVAVGAAEYPNLKFYQSPAPTDSIQLSFEFLEMKWRKLDFSSLKTKWCEVKTVVRSSSFHKKHVFLHSLLVYILFWRELRIRNKQFPSSWKKRWNISGLVGRVTEGSSCTNASKCVLNINSAEGRVNIQNQKRPNIVPQYLANIWIETNIARYLAKFWIGGCQHHNRRGLDLALQLVEAIHKNITHKHTHTNTNTNSSCNIHFGWS